MNRLLRRVLVAAVCTTVVAACALDEAEMVSVDADQVSADVGQLRVLRNREDPEVDRWIDIVHPDEAVFSEAEPFREDDSRTADDDEPADRRRLFTATGTGRTLLVELNCGPCAGDGPGPGADLDVHVWDLVVGDADQPFSPDTPIARPEPSPTVDVGDLVVIADRSGQVPETVIRSANGGARAIERIARHTPDEGADVYVEVYLAVRAGEAVVLVRDPAGDTETYEFRVR